MFNHHHSWLLPQDRWEANEMNREEKIAKHERYLRIAREHEARMHDQSLTSSQRSASGAVRAAALMAAAEWKQKFLKEQNDE